MNAKEKWINSTLESIDTIQKADIPSELSEKIIAGISKHKTKVLTMSPQIKWMVAASIVLLIGLNIVSLLQYKNNTGSQQSSTNPVYKEYFSYLNTF